MSTMLSISVSDLQTIINMTKKQLVEECLSKQIPIKTVNTKNQTVLKNKPTLQYDLLLSYNHNNIYFIYRDPL